LPPCPAAIEAVQRAISNAPCAAGYVPATGLPSARDAIAAYHSTSNLRISSDQVVVASGCSGALELALTALLDDDSILLVPQPGFPLYQVICESHGARTLEYRLDPNQQWQVDLDHLELLLSEHALSRTGMTVRGVVLNNPSNPTGAVYSRAHLQDIVRLCHRYRVPIVSDEVYGNLTYLGHEFVSAAEVASEMGSTVPVIVASGMGKQFLLPGWRVGWVVFCDNADGSLRAVEAGAKRLAQVVLGASHLAQVAVPALLDATNGQVRDWKLHLCRTLEDQAMLVTRALSDAPGLHLCPPAGAMYIMIKLDLDRFSSVAGDVEFCSLLLQQENVVLLPGSCFGAPGYVRIVYCAPPAVLEEAADRMKAFCVRNYK
jgi:tyrosine aminotransferase